MKKSKINTILIGLGNIGCGYDYSINFELDNPQSSRKIMTHARAVSCHPAFKLIAAIDNNKKACDRFNLVYKNFTYESIDSFLKNGNKNIDFVIIAVNPQFQPKLIEEVISKISPKVILLEKPIAISMSEAIKVNNICKKYSNLIVCVNYIRRYLPVFFECKQIISSNKMGKFLHGNIVYGKGLLSNGSHFLNLAQGLLGKLEFFRKLNQGISYGDFDRELSFILKKDSNSFLSMHSLCSNNLRAGEVDLWFEGGRICWLNNGNSLYFWPRVKSDLISESYDSLSNIPTIFNTNISKYQYFVLDEIQKIFNCDANININCSLDDCIETMDLMHTALTSYE